MLNHEMELTGLLASHWVWATAALITAVLLGAKQRIHALLRSLSHLELKASLQLLVIVLVILPLLPNQGMGPWDSINPRVIGWLVILIASISFAGYFAVKLLGARVGLIMTALFAGLVSSTALTLSFSRMARVDGSRNALLGAGIALACGTMALRLLLEVGVVNPALVVPLLPGLLGLALVPLLALLWILLRHQGEHAVNNGPTVSNPLDLQQALIMGGLLTLIFVLSKGAEQWFGNEGIYILSVMAGIADVDAIAITLAQQAKGPLPDEVAARGILLAALTNTAVKAGMVLVVGGWPLARWASSILLVALAAGALGLMWV